MGEVATEVRISDRAAWTPFAVILLCFFLSGATGLIYEVLWLRMLGLFFGHTVYAITTVLAAFMAGLALGSFLFARLATRIRNLIPAYGYLEIGIGVSCALIPVLLGVVAHAYLGLHRVLNLSYDAFSFAQFLLVFLLLLVPTTLMGGTLPVLSQALIRDEAGLGRQVGTLYAVNTFGAVVGVALAGYGLLPALGNRITLWIAVAGNLAVGAVAIWYGLRRGPVAEPDAAAPEAAVPEAVPRARRAARAASLAPAFEVPARTAWLTMAALGISGAVSMIYEVAWTRALALVIGSSTYAFTAMLVAFLVGIAGGSALFSWLLGRGRATPGMFAAIQAGIAGAVLLTVLLFERMPELFLLALRGSDSPGVVQLVQFVVSATSLLPSTLLIGMTFPCAASIAARGVARVGQDVGQVYAANTLGAIGGTILAGFALIPTLGVHAALKIGIILNLGVGAGLLVAAARGRRRPSLWAAPAAALVVAVAVGFLPPWDPRVMSSGPAIYGKSYLQAATQGRLPDILRAQQLLFYRDGPSGTVSVNQEGQHVFLRVNGKMDAGTAVDMPTQLMSGHLPLLLHPDPRRVLVIGLGSGITAGAVSRHPVERLDVVEIEPAVVQASRFFAHVHGNVLSDPRVTTVIADGRNFLLTTPERYDVIISEPSNPWIGGLASLFSVEFFQLARDHLRPGGMVLQWVQGYNLFPEDLQTVVKTFRTAFPAATVWNTIPGDFLLLGRVERTPVNLQLLEARYQTNPGIWRDLDRVAIRAWPGVLGYFMLGEEDTARFSAPGGLNTDDRLPLEFSAPRALYVDTTQRNWELVRSFKVAELPGVTPESRAALDRPDVRFWIGVGYASRQAFVDALPHFQRALEADPNHVPSLLGAGMAHLRLQRPDAALALAQRVLAREPLNAEAWFQAGVASEALNLREQAASLLQRAVTLQPQNREFRTALARVTGGSPPR